MITQAEIFVKSVLRISGEKDKIELQFKDDSVIEVDLDSHNYRILTKPMTIKNIIKNDSF